MKPPTELTLTIPAAIMSVPDLNLIERVILTHIHERPRCANSDLAMLTGLSERGIESTLARLRKLGLIRNKGHGQGRKLFLVEHHIGCGANVNANSHAKCGSNQNEDGHTISGKAASAESHMTDAILPTDSSNDIQLDPTNTKFLAKELDALLLCLVAGTFSQARKHLAGAQQWYSVVCQRIPAMQAHADECFRIQDDRIYIVEAGWSKLSGLSVYERDSVLSSLFEASPQRLAELRQVIEAGKLTGGDVDLKRLIGL